ncbi:SDR family NAD(P)-dependent oxidoreductase [Effusibacillus lacus]|uniref:SDR family oxidoreductase n=1 Tax=Effusibacillus lacus TaxID=1348429 RepID=A0A292YDX7_9BACL|nr:SDR family NAD(P)-dependent oxidoreductase [Effusibacillus lacus]TCS71078.1 short-subunit dehydrogenase [Effusibacillus lacus]GAX90722.1 SDR family oxidoreductase [Effusibacillus lacus]
MQKMSNEVVAVIGGSSGIGKESAKLFAKLGARVILIARGENRLQSTAEEIKGLGGTVEVIAADVSSPWKVKEAAGWIEKNHGRLDAMIFSAAVFYLSPVETMELSLAKQSMDINYWGAVHVTQSFLPLIRKGNRKSLVYLSSLSAQCTPPFFTAYAATKHALRGFVLSLRQELQPEGIHVGMVSPGPINTPLIENDIHQDMYRLPKGIPVLRPEDAARGVVKAVLKQKKDLVIPWGLSLAAKLSAAFPSMVEMYYRLSIPGWNAHILSRTKGARENWQQDAEARS